MTPDVLDLRGVAAQLGRDYHTVKKRWRSWATPGDPNFREFPWPFECPPPGQRGTLRWRASAIDAWKLARERALGAGAACPVGRPPSEAAHDAARRLDRTLNRQRANVAQLLGRA